MALTITINGVTVAPKEASITKSSTVDGRSTLTFVVEDATGAIHYVPGQVVFLNDTTNNITFEGFLNDASEDNLVPNNNNELTIQVSDLHYLADKRYYAGPEYDGWNAGDIAVDLINKLLAAEGVMASYAIRNDQLSGDWASGTLTNVINTTNVGSGDLELSPSGTAVTITETGATFSTGTLVNTQVVGTSLAQTPYNAVKITGTNSINSAGNTYTYYKIWSGSFAVPASPTKTYLIYDIFITKASPEYKIAIDIMCTDGTSLKYSNAAANSNFVGGLFEFDSQNLSPFAQTDLVGLADGQWYHREFNLMNNLGGKTISYVAVAIEGDKTGVYTGYFRNIYLANASKVSIQDIFRDATTTLNTSQQLQNYGYTNVKVSVAKCYDTYDYRWSPSHSISAATISASTLISWTTTTNAALGADNGSTVDIGYSLDAGNTFILCTNNAVLPDFPAGISVSGMSIQFIQFLNSGTTPEDTISLNQMVFQLNPGYNGTKTDITTNVNTNSTWSAGTFSNTTNNGGAILSLPGYTRSWDDGTFANQTPYSAATLSSQGVNNKTFQIGLSTGYDFRSRLDFVGNTWQNFTMEVDIYITSTTNLGFVYRTTNWGNSNDSYAYTVTATTTQILLAHGNNSTGAGSFTSIATASLSISASSWHRLKVVVNGSSHMVYLDDVLFINATDATYTAAGYVGLRHYNASGSNQTGYFDNFGIMPLLTGTWISPSISISGAGSYVSSDVFYADGSTDHTNCTITTDYSTNGGSTWTNVPTTLDVYNDARGVLGFTVGASLSGLSIKYRFTLTTTTASSMPSLNNVQIKIIGSFSGSGNRISPSLSLAPVGRAGSTLVDWSGVAPTNTTIFIDTSLDGSTWSNVGSGASGSAQIAGITTQTDPVLDSFSTDTHTSYTNTFGNGGSASTWTYDTANTRVTAVGGASGLFLYNSASTGKDVDITVLMDESDNGGVVWRYQDASNFYYATIGDASSSVAANSIKCFKNSAGTRTQIGTTVSIAWTRGTPHIFRVNVVSNTFKLYFDGVLVLNTTDGTITASGKCGLYNGGGTSRYYLLRSQFYGDDVTAKTVYTRARLASTDPTVTPQLTDLVVSVHNPNIQNGALIPMTSYSLLNGNRVTLAAIFDDLTKQSPGFWWRIDETAQYYFVNRSAVLAPWVVTGNDIQGKPKIDNINDLYRNSQWLTGGSDTLPITENIIGDGTRQTFSLGYKVASVISMVVDTIPLAPQTIGIKGVDTGKQFYYEIGNNQIIQDPSLTPLDDLQLATVSYQGEVGVTVNVKRDAAITAMKAIDNTTGIIEVAEDGTGMNKSQMITLADGRLTQYCTTGRTIQFDTLRGGLAPGQLVSLFVPQHGLQSALCLITKVDINWRSVIVNGVKMQQAVYTVYCTEGPIVGDYARFITSLNN